MCEPAGVEAQEQQCQSIVSHLSLLCGWVVPKIAPKMMTPPGSRCRGVLVYVAWWRGDFIVGGVAANAINDVKAKLQQVTGVPHDQQRLSLHRADGSLITGTPEDDKRLSDYNIQSFVHIVLS